MGDRPYAKRRRCWLSLALLALMPAAAHAETVALQFYSTVPRNLSEPLAQKFAALNPGLSANLFQAGVETVLEKMELEIKGTGRIQADVMWIEEPAAVAEFAERGLLAPDPAPDLANLLAAYRDPQGRFAANHVAHVFFMYNTARVPAAQAPQSWRDLTQPRYANKLIFSNPRISGTGATVAAAMVQTYGWSYWESIAKLRPLLVAGSQAMTSTIIQGERPIGAIHDYTIGEAIKKGQPIGYVVPAEGGVSLPALVAIANGTPKLDAAKKFFEFMVSRDAAAVLLELGMFHTRVDLPGPAGWPKIDEVKTLPFDWAVHAKQKADLKARFSDLIEQ
jgi:iron(III) transport system substrate-binding protein